MSENEIYFILRTSLRLCVAITYDPLPSTTCTIYNIKRVSCFFSKGIYYPKGCIWEGSQLKTLEIKRKKKQFHLFRNKYDSDNVEHIFPILQIHICARNFQTPAVVYESKKINVFRSSILLKARRHSFCPRKRELAKKGIARRVKHKQSFTHNWRSRYIDWLLLRWRD